MAEYSKHALDSEINKEIRALALNILSGVTLSTPVDTGRARGNWQVGITHAETGTLDTSDKGGALTIRVGASKIGGAKTIPYPAIYISNNLPYIGRLNQGSSTQAPKFFVESAIKRAVND